MARGHKTLK